jgi:hypothetical protein
MFDGVSLESSKIIIRKALNLSIEFTAGVERRPEFIEGIATSGKKRPPRNDTIGL